MKYYLYLDEMLENLTRDVHYFSLAGFAVSEIERDILDAKFNKLKNKHHIENIFHWTELRSLKNLWSQKNEKEVTLFLNDFNLFLEEANITTFASLYNVKLIKDNLKSTKWHTPRHIYAMKKIFENFFLFLNQENIKDEIEVEGYVIVESSTIDEQLKRLFHAIMIIGTDFVSAQGLSKLIKNIEFIAKSKNNNLLQIADPMPSEIYRSLEENTQFSKRLIPYKEEFYKIRKTLVNKQFRGYENRGDLFGIHILK